MPPAKFRDSPRTTQNPIPLNPAIRRVQCRCAGVIRITPTVDPPVQPGASRRDCQPAHAAAEDDLVQLALAADGLAWGAKLVAAADYCGGVEAAGGGALCQAGRADVGGIFANMEAARAQRAGCACGLVVVALAGPGFAQVVGRPFCAAGGLCLVHAH